MDLKNDELILFPRKTSLVDFITLHWNEYNFVWNSLAYSFSQMLKSTIIESKLRICSVLWFLDFFQILQPTLGYVMSNMF